MSSSTRSKRKSPQATAESSTSFHSRTLPGNNAKEARRNRGEIACAECRRLKVRCDRQIPCSTCVSRGCAVLCPNDVLPPGDNSRHLSQATEHLQQKILKMEERMRALEDAVAIAQAEQSSQPHPLLVKPFTFDDEPSPEPQSVGSPPLTVEGLSTAFGTLHVNEKGKVVKFFGSSGGAESLLQQETTPKEILPALQEDIFPLDLRSLGIPQQLDLFFHSFPFAPRAVPSGPAREIIEQMLPPWNRAEELCVLFMEHLSWMFQIVSLNYLTKELLPTIYFSHLTTRRPRPQCYSAHDLALLLIVLAVGALVDLNQEPYNVEAQKYYALARAATCLDSILESGSLATVKLLHLLSIYNGMSGKESALSNTYALLNIAGVLAQRIGLHVDPSTWGLDEKTAYERRAYYWNLLQADLWQSLATGRPPSLANTVGTVRVPSKLEEQQFQLGEITLGFGIWGFRHSQECMLPLTKCINGKTSPSYQQILDLDKRFRSYTLPTEPLVGKDSPISVSMRAWVRSHYLELILLYLHRPFFAKAISSHPDNPLESPYAYSFVTAYQCAVAILRTTKYQFAHHHRLMSRVWQIWTFTFTSAVIVGAVASCSQLMTLDPPPSAFFLDCCDLFTDAAKVNSRAARALPVLLSMREKLIMREKTEDGRYLTSNITYPIQVKTEPGDDDHIEIFAGKTKLVASRTTSPTMPYDMSPSTITPPPVPAMPTYTMPENWDFRPPETSIGGGSYTYTQGTDTSFSYRPHEHNDFTGTGLNHQQYTAPRAVDTDLFQRLQSGVGNTLEPVDFVLEDTWSSFLQTYGALPPQPPS
ncbi:hypothetical protein C8Q75DRAFT_454329 [Abortiporus biennis]|nr:hypothetical protein C8Q75DRAFT_454329 [Abortiporus biennis]